MPGPVENSGFSPMIDQVASENQAVVDSANSALSGSELTTEDLLGQLKDTMDQQEKTSLLTNMMKVMHDMNMAVINAFR